jgi:hypothetical protein
MLSCTEGSVGGPVAPGPGDVVVGPLYLINAKDSVDPNGAGSDPQHGYKYPIAVAPGATVTMMIAAPARGHVVIDNPYGPPAGVVAASYRACRPGQEQGWTVFVQGFTFTDGRTRGCVPLTVRIGREARIRHVTVSLYAGLCNGLSGRSSPVTVLPSRRMNAAQIASCGLRGELLPLLVAVADNTGSEWSGFVRSAG